MNNRRYPSLTWPWVGLLLCLALLGQEYLLQATGPNAPLTAYRITLMAVGVASLALILLPPRRIGYLLGFLVCVGLMGYALYLQYVEGLEPCPLCMLQRICVIAMGVVFLVATFHNPGRVGASVFALLQLLIGGAGAAIAARQVWLQSLPKDQVPACGMGLSYMLETLPFTDAVRQVLEGSGECAEKSWEFLHLSIAGWTLVFFVAMIAASFALIRRD
ncbi:MAG TPA: disulfide bond formation protein B [Casimicrobiaceae bacterium]|nr:disulfide bond formation protein B [Casimicrobiaceae bacterium]